MSLLLLVLALLVGDSQEQRGHTILFPVVFKDADAHWPLRCLAWLEAPYAPRLVQFDASCYYNSSSYVPGDPAAIPVIRPGNFRQVVAGLPHDTIKCIKVLNEPELGFINGLSPAEGVEFVNEVARIFPSACLVGPNVLAGEMGFSWLKEYMELGGLAFDYWGIHIYRESDCSPTDCIDALCLIVACRTSSVWVTETGYDYTRDEAGRVFSRWMREMNDAAEVGRIFGYTPTHAAYEGGNFCIQNNCSNLSATGEAFNGTWQITPDPATRSESRKKSNTRGRSRPG